MLFVDFVWTYLPSKIGSDLFSTLEQNGKIKLIEIDADVEEEEEEGMMEEDGFS